MPPISLLNRPPVSFSSVNSPIRPHLTARTESHPDTSDTILLRSPLKTRSQEVPKQVRFGSTTGASTHLFKLSEEKTKRDAAKKVLDQAEANCEHFRGKISGWTTAGSLIGGVAGSAGTLASAGMDGGTLAGGGALVGAGLFHWFGKQMHASNLREAEEQLEKAKVIYEFHNNRVTTAASQLWWMNYELQLSRENPGDSREFHTLHWDQIKTFRNSPCQDVRDYLLNVFNGEKIAISPAYGTNYKRQVGQLENLVVQMDALASEITSPTIQSPRIEQEQKDAVRAYHRLEGAYQATGDKPQSREFFRVLLQKYKNRPDIATTVLEEMAQFPELRMPDEAMRLFLEGRFDDPDRPEGYQLAVLNLIEATQYPSSTLNFHLKRLKQSIKASEPVRAKAASVLEARQAAGLFQEIDPDAVIQELCSTLIGNPDLEEELFYALDEYDKNVLVSSVKKPALKLWLDGPPGIGKTMLVERLHLATQGTFDGLIPIHIQSDTTIKDIVTRLKEESPLQGKTVFFDEFQNIGTIQDKVQLMSIIEFLKLLTSAKPDDAKTLFNSYGLDFNGSIVAFASNESQADLQIFKASNTTQSLLSRIRNYVQDIQLNSDLTEHIPEVIAQYGPRQLYVREAPQLGHHIQISPEAQEYLTQQVRHQAARRQWQTISGRDIVGVVSNELLRAITRTERVSGNHFPVNNQNHIEVPLVFYLDNGKLMATGPQPAQESEA